MPTYQYKAASASGELLEGRMEAGTREAVIRRLQSQGHVPIRAEIAAETPPAGRGSGRRRLRRRVTRDEVTVFTLELSTLLRAGLPLERALEMLADLMEPGAFKQVLGRVHQAVRGGAYLSSAIEAEADVFSPFYRNMLRAGESSGALDQSLERLADFMERSRALRETVLQSLTYPIVLFAVALISMAIIVGVVVPRFAQMFADAGQTLPLATRVVVTLGNAMLAYGWLAVPLIAGLYWYFRRAYRDPDARLRWDGRLLRTALVGPLITRIEAARFTRTLGTLLGSGVPLLDAIAIAQAVVGNRAIAKGIERVTERVREGEGLARPLQEAAVFPRLAGHLLRVGEETGGLEHMLTRLADIYEREVQTSIRRLVSLVEPALIVGLGVLIAGFILSIVTGILSVNQLAG